MLFNSGIWSTPESGGVVECLRNKEIKKQTSMVLQVLSIYVKSKRTGMEEEMTIYMRDF